MRERDTSSRWWASWRTVALVAAASSVVLALISLSRTAEAAVSLTATPNPVVIPAGQTIGTTLLRWNSDYPDAAVIVLVRDDNVRQAWTSQRQDGSLTVSVEFGHRYDLNLHRRASESVPIATLRITTRRPPEIQAGPPGLGAAPQEAPTAQMSCQFGCITSAQIERHGTYAVLRATASQDVSFRVDVSTLPSLGGVISGGVVSTAVSNGRVREFSPNLLNLAPDTLYDYVLVATDAQGTVERRTGRFLTLRRQIEVTFTRIDMIDDSDDLGSAEMVFMFCANSSVVRHDYRNATIPQFTDGLRWSINFVITLDHAPALLNLSVFGIDDDSGPLSTPVLPGHCTGNAVLSSFDDARGTHAIFFAPSGGPAEGNSGTFLLEARGRELTFDVHGRFTVRYVP